ncbi:MAG: phosphohistidine phosphatase SixA [Brevinematales bacterium]|nr:phosphohistidine phosphatase SixA [Brevinematales bacterium]
MEIFVIRHALAENASEKKNDKERELVEKGFKETKAIAKVLKKIGVKPDLLVSSPLTRAIQTADIIAGKLGYKKKINVAKELLPESKPEDILNLIKSKIGSKVESLVLVGHMPMLGDFISFLLGVKNFSFEIEKSGVYIIELKFNDKKEFETEFKGYITPSIARRLK